MEPGRVGQAERVRNRLLFAGTAVMLAHSDAEVIWSDDEPASGWVNIDGGGWPIEDVAKFDLGRTPDEKDLLFSPYHDLDSLRGIISYWDKYGY
jgi:hypothetical protein